MKKIACTAILGIILILSCSTQKENNDNKDHQDLGSCDFETITSAEQYANAPADALTINSLEINGNCLEINFGASGCNGDSWVLKLIDSESILESYPVQRNLRLSLKNEELCLAYITKKLTFDITNLQVTGNKMLLNLANTKESILYEY